MQCPDQRFSTLQDIAAVPSGTLSYTAVGVRTVGLPRRASAKNRVSQIGAFVFSILRVAAKRYRLALVASFALMSCAKAGPTCSENRVTDLVKQIAKKQLASVPQIQVMYDLDETSYEVRSIRTIDQTDRACKCAASFHSHFELGQDLKTLRDTKPDEFRSLNIRVPDFDLDIKYTAQLTDDGKEVYVDVKGF